MVSAWARNNGVVLAQEKVAGKSNEIKAIPKLLKILEIAGCIVTIDAMGCQKKIAKKILKQKADYVLALKKNHKTLYKNVESFFEECSKNSFENVSYESHTETEKGHGRTETRQYYITNDLTQIETKEEWAGLKSIGMTISEREIKGVVTTQVRYHLCSIEPNALKYADAVRGHWAIENSAELVEKSTNFQFVRFFYQVQRLHWILDVVFHEDSQRNRKDNSPENMAIIRHTALNLMKNDPSVNLSMRQMKKKLEWDHDYAMSLIFGDILP